MKDVFGYPVMHVDVLTSVIAQVFLKSSPRFYGFMVCGGIVGGYYLSRMWDHSWAYVNKGLIYKDCPYVYPPEEED